MDDKKISEKEVLDAHLKLCERAWEQFNQRRKFEAQFSMAIWTSLAVYLGFLITGKIEIITCQIRCGTICSLLTLIFIHCIWLYWTNKTNKLDQEIAKYHEKKIMDLTVNEFSPEIRTMIADTEKYWPMRYSSGFITFLLAILIVVVTVLMPSATSSSSNRNNKCHEQHP